MLATVRGKSGAGWWILSCFMVLRTSGDFIQTCLALLKGPFGIGLCSILLGPLKQILARVVSWETKRDDI